MRASGGLLALLLALSAPAALAHKSSDAYLALAVEGERVTGQWDIALRDLEFALGLDADGDGAITWGEVRSRHPDIAQYALARLALAADGAPCPATVTEQLVDRHTDGAYTVLRFAAQCPHAPRELGVRYTLFADLDPQHRGLARIDHEGASRTALFGPESAAQSFALASPGRLAQFGAFFRQGTHHIWIGIDHVLFLVSLLLPAVLVRRYGRWLPVDGFAPAFWDTFKVVTSFTVAHSITLSVAALGLVALPSRLVESAIAASVVLAALNNLRPVVLGARWAVAFGFGLVHGFGFASVLAELGLPRDALVTALVGFNLGVEAGQLAIVAAFLPVAYALRATLFYRRFVLYGGSALIALLAAVWCAERALDLKLIGL